MCVFRTIGENIVKYHTTSYPERYFAIISIGGGGLGGGDGSTVGGRGGLCRQCNKLSYNK